MRSIQLIIFPLALLFTAVSCKKDDEADADLIEFHGIIAEQGITTYQYGSHTIGNGSTGYALTSETVNLDDYIGDTVTVKGYEIDGYPVEDGPLYLNVTEVIP